MRISAHQPNFMPYLGFFHKMKESDIFVIRDEILFSDNKDAFQHRNKIRINSNNNKNSPQHKWISVPIDNKNDYIKNVLIKNYVKRKNILWNEEILKDIRNNYGKTPYFDEYFPYIQEILSNNYDKLIKLNMKMIYFLRDVFGIKTKIIFASDLGLKPDKYQKSSDSSNDIINICSNLGGKIYLSGSGGREYLNLEMFKRKGLKVEFQEYYHPIYQQRYEGFIPNMSSIDALFCIGKNVFNELEIRNKKIA